MLRPCSKVHTIYKIHAFWSNIFTFIIRLLLLDPAKDVERLLKYLKHGNSPLTVNSSQSPRDRQPLLVSPSESSNRFATPIKPVAVRNYPVELLPSASGLHRFHAGKSFTSHSHLARSHDILANVLNGAHKHIGTTAQKDSKLRRLRKHNSFPAGRLSSNHSHQSNGTSTTADMMLYDDDGAAFCVDPKLDMILSQYETEHLSRQPSPVSSAASSASTTASTRIDRIPHLQQVSVTSSTKDVIEDFDFDDNYWQDPKLNLLLSQVEGETRHQQRSL